MNIENAYVLLTRKAAAGDRNAARRLIIEGYWPQNWDADDTANLDRVIEGSRVYREWDATH